MKLLRKGVAPEEIGKIYTITKRHVCSIGANSGIKRSLKKTEQDKRNRKIFNLLRQGQTFAETGRQFNISLERVRQLAIKESIHAFST